MLLKSPWKWFPDYSENPESVVKVIRHFCCYLIMNKPWQIFCRYFCVRIFV